MEIHIKSKEFFYHEIWWQINCGHSSIMYDNWTHLGALYFHLPVSYSNKLMEIDVEQLMIEGRWNVAKLRVVFPNENVHHIHTSIDVNTIDRSSDNLFWMPTTSGNLLLNQPGRF